MQRKGRMVQLHPKGSKFMKEIYERVAADFAEKIDHLFESEKSLETTFKQYYEGLPFDRTEHWSGIIHKILSDSWKDKGPEVKCEPTGMDKLQIMRYLHHLLDYNIFTQVLLNLQGYTGMFYMTGDAQAEIERMKSAWSSAYKLDPFAPKAKMLKQAEAITEEQKQYNQTISALRALRIITQFTPQISFRVSPKGSTPAFADSRNISMIGLGGDRFLKTISSLKPYYITWNQVPQIAQFIGITTPPGHDVPVSTFKADGISYEFHSKSGGEVIQDVLFARKIMYEIFRDVNITRETCIMIPRMNSILIVGDVVFENLQKAYERLYKMYPVISFVDGIRA